MTLQEIYQAVIAYDIDKTSELVRAEIDKGSDINEILSKGLIAPL
ncbi:MAG: cobalamin-binding protein, partial [Deltaproteobacteria bacterium]|nr:cobalamin-binding protein [Deltaproteobacteria bacterium]